MFPNLIGQKAIHRMSNEDMAKVIDVSRRCYENKMNSGRFTAAECRKYCIFFKKPFEYLFAVDQDETA